MRISPLGLAALLAIAASTARAQNVPLDFRFSYQGELRQNGVVVDQPADFRFSLFDQPAGGNAIGTTNVRNAVPVTRGVFEVELDFGNTAFAGDRRHLQIEVRTPAGAGAFTTLTPRVELTPAPNAHYSRFSGIAFNAFTLDGVDSTAFVQKNEANSITSAMLTTASVTGDEIAGGAVTGAKIADGSVGLADLASNSVDSARIVNGSVTAADLAPGAVDGGNAGTVDGLDAAQFLRSDASDVIASNTTWAVSGGAPNVLTFGGSNLELFLGDTSADRTTVVGRLIVDGPAVEVGEGAVIEATDDDANFSTSLTIHGGAANLFTLNLGDSANDAVDVSGLLYVGNSVNFKKDGPKRIRCENAAGALEAHLSYEPLPNAWDATGALRLGSSSVLTVGAPIGATFTPLAFNSFGGNTTPPMPTDISTQDDLRVDDSLEIGDDLYLGTFSADPTIYFESGGNALANWLRYDDVTNVTGCSALPSVTSAFVSAIMDNSTTGWVFQNPADNEFVIHSNGNVEMDGTLTTGGSCDVAEAFFGDASLAPGTLVRLDETRPEGVVESTRAYDEALVGVVSTRPGVLLRGPSADAYPMFAEMDRARAAAGAAPGDEALARRVDDLELALDAWARGEVAVALAGRVPVKVVGPVALGQPLTSSDVAGHAMALDRPGPSIGIAMETKASAGPGTVLVLVGRGFASPVEDVGAPHRQAAAADAPDVARVVELERRLEKVEQRVGRGEAGPADRDALSRRFERKDGADRAGRRDGAPAPDRTPVVGIPAPREAWGDVDGDGLEDVAVLDARGLVLLRNVGHGEFRDVTSAAGLGEVARVRSALLADLDGDLHVDLLVVDDDGAGRLLRGTGAFTFDDVTTALGLDLGRPIADLQLLDHDRDGRKDLRAALADGTLLLHHNRGGGAFSTTTLRSAVEPVDASAADDRIAALEAQVAALSALVEALRPTNDEER